MTSTEAAVLVYPGVTLSEVIELATRLHRSNYEGRFLSPSGDPVDDESGLTVQADGPIDTDGSELAALVLPGGDIGSVYGSGQVQAFVAGAHGGGAVVAAVCAGVLIAADAGVTAGKRITHNYRIPFSPPEVIEFGAPLIESAVTEHDLSVGVVVDGNLVTALPNAIAEFTVATCRLLGLYDQAQSGRLLRHLRGAFVPELFGY